MNTILALAFIALLVIQALGTGAFLAIYLRGSDWRTTAVGRHLAYYASALLGLYATTLVSFFVHAMWLVWLILALHAVFGGVIWQRVVLVWRAQHG